MAKSKIDKDDIKRLVENTSNPSSTTSVYSAKYVDDNFLKEITKAMVEAKLTGVITSHDHNYTTSTDVQTLINTAIASVYKPKGNIANKTALLALTNIKQGDVYNALSAFTLNGQNVKIGDNIVCLSNSATSLEANWDNLGGNIDFAAALSQALVGFSATSGSITSSDTILSAINKLAYDKHTHSNKAVLDAIVNTLAIYGGLDPQDLRDAITGVHELIEGNLYSFAPNPVCGTDTDSDSLFGKLIILENIDGTSKTLYYHSYKTNKIHVCSGYDNGSIFIWNNWERLLTCKDKPQTIQADIDAESIYHLPIPATGTTDYTFYLNGFDGKNGNKIEIDLGTIAGSVNMNKRVVEIYVSPAQPNIDVSFYCAGLNSFTPTASYTDPLLVSGNIYYMKFIFLKQTTYWSVDNNIAYF